MRPSAPSCKVSAPSYSRATRRVSRIDCRQTNVQNSRQTVSERLTFCNQLSSEVGATPAAAAWASPLTDRMAPPSRKARDVRPALSTGKLPRGARTDHGCGWHLGRICSSPTLHATLHGLEMGTPSPRASWVSALRPASRWLARGSGVRLPACVGGVSGLGRVGGVTPVECRKGSNRAKVTRP